VKLRRLLTVALFVPGLTCLAQDQTTPAPRAASSNPTLRTTALATATPPATAQVRPMSTQAAPQTPHAPVPAPVQAPVQAPAGQVPPSQTAPPPAAGAPSNTYIIGPSDVLSITVWKEPTLSSSLLVRPDGMISLPLLGDVLATGLTPLQLADQIASKLKKFVQDPNVSVVVSQIHSKIVYLLGEVGKKGPIEMTPGLTVLEAIGSAGGLTDYANAKKIYILRNAGGKNEKIPVKYKQALKGDRSLDLVLKSGDTIVVP
jgi:polysaccharide biosynthesis/export protein